jgi:NADH-quinone oxidoreductase subunit F
MPAIAQEIEQAIAEGVEIRFLVAPVAVEGVGRAQAVRCVEMELGEADDSGRRRPVPRPEAEATFPADHVIVAIGQAPELAFAGKEGRLVVSRGRIAVDPVTMRSGEGKVFAGGDAVTGPASLIEAVAAGQRAARAIDKFLGGKGELPPDTGFAARSRPEEWTGEGGRRPVKERLFCGVCGDFGEVVQGYCAEEACAEARRCLRCDLER